MTLEERVANIEACVAGLIDSKEQQDEAILLFGGQVPEVAVMMDDLRLKLEENRRRESGYDGWIQPGEDDA
jgi:hypothetical protein